LLISDREGRAATVSRMALGFFVLFYSAFDAIVGIGSGMLVALIARLPVADRGRAALVTQQFWDARLDPSLRLFYLILIAELAWLVAACAAAITLRRAGAAWQAIGLLVLAGICFATNHTFQPTPSA
jgi:hypothetical protein